MCGMIEFPFNVFEQFSKDHQEVVPILKKIAKSIYIMKISRVPLSDEVKKVDFSSWIQHSILTITTDTVGFTNPKVFQYFLAKELIESHFNDLWEQNDKFWEEIEELQRGYLSFELIHNIEVMLLIIYNREYGRDILEPLARIIKEGTRRNQWSLLQIAKGVVPYLNIDAHTFSDFVEDLHNADIPYLNQLAEVAEVVGRKSPVMGRELWKIWTETPRLKAIWLIKPVAIGIAQNEGIRSIFPRVLELLESSVEMLVGAGISICGFLPYEETTNDILNTTLEKFDILLQNEFRIQLRQALAQAYGNLIPKTEKAQFAVRTLASERIPEIQRQIAEILHTHSEKHKEIWFQEALLQLTKVDIGNKGTIDQLDFVLYQLISNDLLIIEKFLERWVLEHTAPDNTGSVAHLFNTLFHELHSEQNLWVEKLITSWFIRDDMRFHMHIQGIVHHLAVHDLIFQLDPDIINNWSYKDVKYVLIKIMGYIMNNKNLVSLAFSILQRSKDDDEVNQLVRSAFKEYIAYNYPGTSRKFLVEKADNGSEVERKVSREILFDLDVYQQSLRRLPKIKEFYPPESRAKKFENMKSKKMNRSIQESTDENSVFVHLVHRVVLKGGRSSFSRLDGQFTEKMGLSAFSIEMEFPRGEKLDPTGQAMKRLDWRLCRREDVQ